MVEVDSQDTNKSNFFVRVCDLFPRGLWRMLCRAPAHLDDAQLLGSKSCIGAAYCTYIVGFILAAVFIASMCFTAEKAIRSKSWKATEAKILSSKENAHFRARIQYAYAVGGKSYESFNINAMDIERGDPDLCHRLLAAYPASSTRLCYFDPSRPNDSVLLSGIRHSGVTEGMYKIPLIFCLILGTLLLVCGYYFACSRSPYTFYIAKLIGIVAVVGIGEFYIYGLPLIENSLFENLAPPVVRMDESSLPQSRSESSVNDNGKS